MTYTVTDSLTGKVISRHDTFDAALSVRKVLEDANEDTFAQSPSCPFRYLLGKTDEAAIADRAAQIVKARAVLEDLESAQKREAPSFLAFIRAQHGKKWVIARRTQRIIRQYGADVVCLTPEAYANLQNAYTAATGLAS